MRSFFTDNIIFIIIFMLIVVIIYFDETIWRKNVDVNKTFGNTLLTEAYLGSSQSLITPIPQQVQLDPGKQALGKQLFYDTRLSNFEISCNTCHNLANAGIDGLKQSIKIGGGHDEMNTPTVFNAGLQFRQLWNGEAETLEAQIEKVIHNRKHMASSWPEVIERLNNDTQYPITFQAHYVNGITADNIKDALAIFLRSLITPNARFDQYLNGDDNAISEDQKSGYFLFQQYGCVYCHQGVLIGGNVFTRYGIINDPFLSRPHLTKTDLGRYSYTKDINDKHVFKVPSLRNIEKTAPYFHDGSAMTLEDTVKIIAWTQLGRDIPDSDVSLIVEFLKSLTGKYLGQQL